MANLKRNKLVNIKKNKKILSNLFSLRYKKFIIKYSKFPTIKVYQKQKKLYSDQNKIKIMV